MNNTHYEVHAVLSEYAGNHERELTAWVFGALSEYMPGGWEARERPHAEEMAWAYNPDGIEGTLEQVVHEEYGLRWETIDHPDPIGDPPQYGHVVVWRLAEAPTDEQWEALKRALDSYEVIPKSYNPNPAKVRVKHLFLTRVETIYTKMR